MTIADSMTLRVLAVLYLWNGLDVLAFNSKLNQREDSITNTILFRTSGEGKLVMPMALQGIAVVRASLPRYTAQLKTRLVLSSTWTFINGQLYNDKTRSA
ncbi:hypothetical protein EG329_009781 [Mollisiaceae sp. DMI_Dod_QoI]|nr:hypothetical protein EG329_009781 [Helotiales sp. DMI_Dod_QoI]